VYAVTGYRPMLPLVLEEKGRVTPSRAVGAPLEYAGYALAAVDRGLAHLAGAAGTPDALSPAAYAAAMTAAIDAAHRQARGVVVVLSPAETEQQRRNLAAVLGAVLAAHGTPSWLRLVDLGDTPELLDRSLRLDDFSFGATATSIAARAIAPAFLSLIPPR
jgi:hypothetical protein